MFLISATVSARVLCFSLGLAITESRFFCYEYCTRQTRLWSVIGIALAGLLYPRMVCGFRVVDVERLKICQQTEASGPICEAVTPGETPVSYACRLPALSPDKKLLISWQIDASSLPSNLNINGVRQALGLAAASWEEISGLQGAIEFLEDGTIGPGIHQIALKWNPHGCKGGDKAKTLGTYVYNLGDPVKCEWYPYEVCVDGMRTWVTDRDDRSGSYLPSVLAHEIGHVLGLGHATDANTMMWTELDGPGLRQRRRLTTLHADDIDGIRYLYGPNREPIYLSFNVSPLTAGPGEAVALEIDAVDAEQDALLYKWEATGGRLQGCSRRVKTCQWRAPLTSLGARYVLTGGLRDEKHGIWRKRQVDVTIGLPPQQISVSVQPDVAQSALPVRPLLTVRVNGATRGKIDYIVYCNRPDSGVDVVPGYAARFRTRHTSVTTGACIYADPGTYTAKVIVRNGNTLPAEARTTITVVGCGDDVMQSNEQCDGSDDAACPGRCQPDCTCEPLVAASITPTPTGLSTATPTATGPFERVSVSSLGVQADANSFNGVRSISTDGRYVLFQSNASNLVPGVLGAYYIRDRVLGTTEAVPSGYTTTLSSSGRYLAYTAPEGVLVHDRESGATEIVSVNASGPVADNFSQLATVSADGQYVAFDSDASDLVPNDTNNWPDIFIRDRVLGTTERVSVGNDGSQGSAASFAGQISGDGRFVIFNSNALTLGTGVLLRDRIAGTTEVIAAGQGNAISEDGRFIVFGSSSSCPGICLLDQITGTTEVIDNSGSFGTVTNDGRFVAYNARMFGVSQIMLRDRMLGSTQLVTVDDQGNRGNGDSYVAVISGEGGHIVFQSNATNLVPNDTNGWYDVFVYTR